MVTAVLSGHSGALQAHSQQGIATLYQFESRKSAGSGGDGNSISGTYVLGSDSQLTVDWTVEQIVLLLLENGPIFIHEL